MAETTTTTHKPSRQTLRGVVVSDKMMKTRTIEVKRTVRHDLYHKSMERAHRFFIHDEKNESKVGDVVLAEAIRPLSRNKKFRLKQILGKTDVTAKERPAAKENPDEPQDVSK